MRHSNTCTGQKRACEALKHTDCSCSQSMDSTVEETCEKIKDVEVEESRLLTVADTFKQPYISLPRLLPPGTRLRMSKFGSFIRSAWHEKLSGAGVPSFGQNDWKSDISLNGLLVGADAATSSKVVGITGVEEAAVWDAFAPLQRVLIVAVTAAAASANKQREMKKLMTLQHALENRDKELVLLNKKIGQLQDHLSYWKEQAQTLRAKPDGKCVTENPGMSVSTPKCSSVILEQYATPQVWEGKRIPAHVMRQHSRNDNTDTPEGISRKSFILQRLSEHSSFSEEQFEMLTPELPLRQMKEMITPEWPAALKRKNAESDSHVSQKLSLMSPTLKMCSISPGNNMQAKDLIERTHKIDVPQLVHNFTLMKNQLQLLEDLYSQSSGSIDSESHMTVVKELKSFVERASENVSSLEWTISNLWELHEPNSEEEISFARSNVCLTNAQTESLNEEHILCRGDWSMDVWESNMNFSKIPEDVQKMTSFFTEADNDHCPYSCELRCSSETVLTSKLESHEALEGLEKGSSTCTEACKTKDTVISRLEEEITALQETVSDLSTLQKHQVRAPSSVQTLMTSNLLFSLDSPVKIDGSQSIGKHLSPLKRTLDQVSKTIDCLDGDWDAQSCENDHMESRSSVSVFHVNANNKRYLRRDFKKSRGNREHVGIAGSADRSTSSTDQSRRSSISSTEVSRSSTSSLEESSSIIRTPSLFPVRSSKNVGSKKSNFNNVLVGVEPNTSNRTPKVLAGKDRNLKKNDIDNNYKSKENLNYRRKWV